MRSIHNGRRSSQKNEQTARKQMDKPAHYYHINFKAIENFSSTINKIWASHKQKLPGKLKKLIVCYRRPQNLKTKFIRARFYDGTTPKQTNTHLRKIPLFNQPLKTYNREELRTYTEFITIRCQLDHQTTTDKYNNLEEAILAYQSGSATLFSQHTKCGEINIIPTKAISHISTKCTKCNYVYRFKCNVKPSKVDLQLKHTVHSIQNGLFRKAISYPSSCFRPNCHCYKQHLMNKE